MKQQERIRAYLIESHSVGLQDAVVTKEIALCHWWWQWQGLEYHCSAKSGTTVPPLACLARVSNETYQAHLLVRAQNDDHHASSSSFHFLKFFLYGLWWVEEETEGFMTSIGGLELEEGCGPSTTLVSSRPSLPLHQEDER
ncbi:hypothetical protein PanWU01x14_316470 [Parasponia andersonii]|uniref:Uncharacterized protein n=1 Tax=Parasponia andersonii TaxID=3476 RepID=A0A2P5AN36_PARAD|nr:hypothetical protein PanWU01x14_316470 [Parasponia andersonii]